ncbi:transcriptional regulator, partial [Bifidobacteriaceae bacterium NR016]
QIIRDEYADAEIIMLTVTKFIPNSSEKFMDNFIGCITTLFGDIPLFDT